MVSLKLTDLPVDTKALIFDKLSDPPLSSFTAPSSCNASKWCADLTEDLFHAAQSSQDIKEAVIVAMGPHARYLNFFQTKWVWKWIPILKGHVKAIDIAGIDIRSYCEGGCDHESCHRENPEVAILETLRTLITNNIELEELNMATLGWIPPNRAKEIADYMVEAVQRSSSSLKTIGLKANEASVQAVKSASLPKLKTLHISADSFSNNYRLQMPNTSTSEDAICQILKATNANAGCTRNISSVRELILGTSLCSVSKISSMEFESCPRLFLGVKKLVLVINRSLDHEHMAKFISNFRGLEILSWHGVHLSEGLAQDTKTIFEACPDLKELRLMSCRAHKHLALFGVGITRDLFLSSRGQLQTANFGYLTQEQIKVLGESIPNLRTLYLKIDQANISALPLLLGNLSCELRHLHLGYQGYRSSCLRGDGWWALSNAFRCAPHCLRTTSLVGDELSPRIGSETEYMVDAVIDILECMGNRAENVIFSIPMRTTSPLVLLKGLCRILKSAVINCKSVENLCLNFVDSYSALYARSQDAEDEIIRWYKAVSELQDILSGQPGEVNIGNVDYLLKRKR